MTLRPESHLKRLFVRAALAAGAEVELDQGQANYLVNVLRMNEGDPLLLFNGRDGEWRATLAARSRRARNLVVGKRLRGQTPPPDLHYLFVPLKQARLDYMVEKATEMGAGRLRPVLSQHGQVTRINTARMEANAIEAAEQCGLMSVPAIDEPAALLPLLEAWAEAEGDRRLIFCDEDAASASPLAILSALPPSPLAVLIGPEGGFSTDERERLRTHPAVTAISLGPRIIRADTAAVAALAVVQAALGDWR
jgi:16S rRNA (uracil1498-N3)-methyltransferase